MPQLFFLQMSGAPGSGKSTLACALAPRVNGVIIDHDVTKCALLDADVPAPLTGHASYTVLVALARHLLSQDRSVIFDSPCLYESLLRSGQQVAAEFGASHRYIECRLENLHELDRRLQSRPRMRSQVAGVHAAPTEGSSWTEPGEAHFRRVIDGMKRPEEPYLVIDTSQPLGSYIERAEGYVQSGSVK